MKELTNEQYAKIGNLVYDLGWPGFAEGVSRGNERLGRAAVAAVAPLLLSEPSEDEWVASHTCPELWRDNPNRMGSIAVCRKLISNRLGSTVTSLDPAVEAVKAVVERAYPQGNYNVSDDVRLATIRAIVAAVDEARKGAK